MNVEIAEFHAREQKLKSIMNRINRAKRGIPSTGKISYGRIYDKKTGEWKIDPEKQKIIKDIAKRYLRGESLKDLAKEYGMNASNLHKILTKGMGRNGKWNLRLRT